MDIITKAALNQGMSNYVFVVYRHVVATVVIAPFAVVLDKLIPFPFFQFQHFQPSKDNMNSSYCCGSHDHDLGRKPGYWFAMDETMIFLQAVLAGMDIITKAALNQGMSNYVFVVYRHVVATVVIAPFAVVLDKKKRPKMTTSIFVKITILNLLEPVIDQNLYFLGMKYTTATFAVAMANVLPAITFVMAYLFRLEKIRLMSIRSQAKIIGTLATVAGAMIMTLVEGPNIGLPWTKQQESKHNVSFTMKLEVQNGRIHLLFHKAKPFLAVIFLQAVLAGMDINTKATLNQGMSNYVFVVYRHVVATVVIDPFVVVLDKLIPFPFFQFLCVNYMPVCIG
ncbi:hypothetical protein F511_29438 [Dorcoceras hygrometricum]|uniref:WAT1-related protein n=1 Tax=Dorcoceras hygrometricum TaxID=472368 RepID=A0A2Z7DEY2_9LAMI|nr:hypothetical protein F511_29438 [Dorcoceras hygrometricum]